METAGMAAAGGVTMFLVVGALASMIFPLIWIFVVVLIARTGGWSSLAQDYPCKNPPTSWNLTMGSGSIGWSRYRSSLSASWDERGLYLHLMFLFRPGHEPLFIPWSSIVSIEKNDSLMIRGIRVHVAGPGNRDIRFWGELADQVEKAWNKHRTQA